MKMNRTWLSQTLAVQCSEIVVKIYVFMMDRGEIDSGDAHMRNVAWPGGEGVQTDVQYFSYQRIVFCFWLLSLTGASKNCRNIF
jgi:hypothetical protein